MQKHKNTLQHFQGGANDLKRRL